MSKKFVISHEAPERYVALRDILTNGAKGLFRRKSSRNDVRTKEDFYALQDINFEIGRGDRVGIIGRNGAGKSTLLKVLSRITEPTTGRISIRGRVASLLEVGTGFHPELTGRENVFLNGAILGMTRVEVRKKFDEIVAFAEVEKFLDTPVKRYSSGMYVRLAFSVAAHLEPEILILDEVLAVGDSQFQKKCLGKMEDVSKNDGRTVLLVSHSMTTVQALANHVIFLSKGKSEGMESVHSGVQKYLYGGAHGSEASFRPNVLNEKSDAYILSARLLNKKNELSQSFFVYEPIRIELEWMNKAGVTVMPNFMMVSQQGITVMVATDGPVDFDGSKKSSKGVYLSVFEIPENLLNAGDFYIHIALDNHSPRICYEYHNDVFRFTVIDPMDEFCIARGAIKSVREDAVLWPALKMQFFQNRMQKMNIPFFNTHIDPSAREMILQVLDSTFLSEGKLVSEFESGLSKELGLVNPVALNSGTTALHLALVLAGIGEGDEVILSPQTFVASGLVILQQKARPVFADIQYETGNICPLSIKARLSPRTKAIMVVHWGGYPCDMDEIMQIANEHNLTVIEDAAHAIGASYKETPVGAISPLTAFSFQAIKHLTTGDGGALACLDPAHYHKAVTLRWFGIDRNNSAMSVLGERQYDITEMGYKYHMNDYAAALGIANLRHFRERFRNRIKIAAHYRDCLKEIPGISLFQNNPDRQSAFWLFGFHVEKREDFILALKDRGVAASVVHQRIDRNSVFGGPGKELTAQAKFDATQVNIPIHDGLDESKVDHIISAIRKGW